MKKNKNKKCQKQKKKKTCFRTFQKLKKNCEICKKRDCIHEFQELYGTRSCLLGPNNEIVLVMYVSLRQGNTFHCYNLKTKTGFRLCIDY